MILNYPLFQNFWIGTKKYFTSNRFLIVSNNGIIQNFSLFGPLVSELHIRKLMLWGDVIWHFKVNFNIVMSKI